jgi:hypothetical protein
MELLIAILLQLGFYYTPEQVNSIQTTGAPNEEIINAQHIIQDHLYHYDEDGGVVIEDDVDPDN